MQTAFLEAIRTKSNPVTTEPVLVDKVKVTTSPVWTHFSFWVKEEGNPTASKLLSAICA